VAVPAENFTGPARVVMAVNPGPHPVSAPAAASDIILSTSRRFQSSRSTASSLGMLAGPIVRYRKFSHQLDIRSKKALDERIHDASLVGCKCVGKQTSMMRS
jgi:hypothetical protein